MSYTTRFPNLFSKWRIRYTEISNRVVFAPLCPTWVRSPHEGAFTDQAVAYYEERAKTGLGMIILGGHIIHTDTIYTPLFFPGLWDDSQIEGLAKVASAVKKHGCAIAVQLLHIGLRSPLPYFKADPALDPEVPPPSPFRKRTNAHERCAFDPARRADTVEE